MRQNLFYLLTICLLCFTHTASASLIGIDTVDGKNSLYYETWGHPYTGAWGGENAEEGNARNVGNPARAFEASSGVPYGFMSGDNIQVTATGCVVDSGSSCTDPDYLGGDFRLLPVYALIGIWSTSSTSITPIDSIITNPGFVNPAFLIGSSLNLLVPDVSSPLYLFMATNDGNFSDNSGAYTVRIDKLSSVPAPSVIWLMLFGILLRKHFLKASA